MITNKQIAEALGVSYDRVKRSFQRADTKIKPEGVGAKSVVKVLGKYVDIIDREKQKYTTIKNNFENKIKSKGRNRHLDQV